MTILQAIVYGVVQGITEFLPISSTAHLRVVPALLGWEDPGAAFTAIIQIGTVLAMLVVFGGDLWRAFLAWGKSLSTRDISSYDAKVGWGVFVATIPIVIVGFLLHKQIETVFRSLYVISGSLIFMGLLMGLAEKFGKKSREIESVTVKDGLIVGLWQCIALIPGMSRSGSTITGAYFADFDRKAAARFSFLMSVPSITAAGLYEAVKEREFLTGSLQTPILVATVVSFFVGWAAIKWLLAFIQQKGIGVFIGYRVVLGLVLITLCASGKLDPNAGIVPDQSNVSQTK